MRERAIPKSPNAPDLTAKQIELLTQLCFKSDAPQPADLIFNFSTPHGISDVTPIITSLVNNNYSTNLFSGGGIPDYTDSAKIAQSESDLLITALPNEIAAKLNIFTEKTSRNFLENVTEALKVLDFSSYKTIIYITKAHASGRAYLTLRKFCPHTTLLAQTYSPLYDQERITSSNWANTTSGRNRVWGEYLRIRLYGDRGQIEYNEVKDLVEQIDPKPHD